MSFGELLFLSALALLVFGPKRLPEIARLVGKTMAELRRASNEFRHSLEEEIRTLEHQEQLKKSAEVAALGATDATPVYDPYAGIPTEVQPPSHTAPPESAAGPEGSVAWERPLHAPATPAWEPDATPPPAAEADATATQTDATHAPSVAPSLPGHRPEDRPEPWDAPSKW